MGPKIPAKKGPAFLRNVGGQSTVEYVLILTVTVSVVLLFSSMFYQPFKIYLNNYMGQYLQCLLDYGELPKLGGNDTTSECDSEFKAFRIGDGRPRKDANGNNPNALSEKNSNDERKEMSDSRSGNSGSGYLAGQTGSGSSASRGKDGAGENGNVTTEYAELSETQYQKVPSNFGGQQGTSNSKRFKVSNVETLSYADRKRVQKGTIKKPTSIILEEEAEIRKAKSFTVPTSHRKVASESEDEGFTFGEMIRIAIILMLILAIFVFLAGQILQITKSWQK